MLIMISIIVTEGFCNFL